LKNCGTALKETYRATDDLAAATALDALDAGLWGNTPLPFVVGPPVHNQIRLYKPVRRIGRKTRLASCYIKRYQRSLADTGIDLQSLRASSLGA
jgi:hypothetical protein